MEGKRVPSRVSHACSPIWRWHGVMVVHPRLMRALGGVKLLILDDWGLEPLGPEQRRDLLEVAEDRASPAVWRARHCDTDSAPRRHPALRSRLNRRHTRLTAGMDD